MEQMQVTSIEDLKQLNRGTVVELPPFAENFPFYARLKRPSMMALARSGKIPNELLTSANSLFKQGTAALDVLDQSMMDKLFQVMDIICEASFVEPTYKELKDAGVQLTDDQLTFIFGYSQNGVRQLKSFRE